MGSRTAVLIAAGLLASASGAGATPVATTPAEREALGRVFPEPLRSTDFINHGTAPDGPSELAGGFGLLEQVFPAYFDFTSVHEELGDPDAVSLGPDGRPAWSSLDTDDGLPFYVAKVTDESVPDEGKAYVLLLNAHPQEPCGQEGMPRFLEDLLIWRTDDPEHMLDDGAGRFDKRHRMTVAELLRKVKIFFVSTSPDGWAKGEGPASTARNGNFNYANFNENRVAYQEGWVFPPSAVFATNGYSVLTQPEGAAVTKYLQRVRANELGGRPFAVANDQHGPFPESGALLFHEQGNDPAKLERLHDYGQRLKDNMLEVLERYATSPGASASQELARAAGSARDRALHAFVAVTGQPVSEKTAYLTFEWAAYATVWEHLDYTVTGSWGGFAGSRAGLGADSITFETACDAQSGRFSPPLFQLFVDNVRAATETGVVHAAQRAGLDEPAPVVTHDLGGRIGYLDTGKRVTDADGNPKPPPKNHPNTPLMKQIAQVPYDVANTDYFRDLRRIVRDEIVGLPPAQVSAAAGGVDTLVVADTTDADTQALREFVTGGGNLVLTDRALGLLPELTSIPAGAVSLGHSYVGYSDLDREHPWTEGLHTRARQTYDPVGLGYPLMMARDTYWPRSSGLASPTENSAPVWMVSRDAWTAAGGVTIGTADPPADRRFGGEGTDTDRTTIGVLPRGAGRIVIFGGLLPQPTEQFDHWFGLDPYTVTITGQHLLLKALGWTRPDEARGLRGGPARATGRPAAAASPPR